MASANAGTLSVAEGGRGIIQAKATDAVSTSSRTSSTRSGELDEMTGVTVVASSRSLADVDATNTFGRIKSGTQLTDQVSFGRLTVNMVLCGLGAGILSLPWTTAGAGLVNATVWNASILGLSYYTMMLMVNAAERHQVYEMEGLLERCDSFGGRRFSQLMTGARWRLFCSGAIWVSYWMALLGYLIIISDSVVPTVKFLFGMKTFDRKIPVVCGALIILPLCFLSQKSLAVTSLVGVFSNCFVVFAVALNFFVGSNVGADAVCLLGFTSGNITYVSAICMAMVIQPCVLPMYETMANRSPQNFSKMLIVAFSILWVIFTIFSTFAYMSYGSKVEGNVLNNLPSSAWYAVTARAGMSFVAIGVYPLMLFPMIAPIKQRRWRTIAIAIVLLSTVLAGCVADDLGVLNVACGALSTFFFIALFPVVIGTSLGNATKGVVMGTLFVLGTISAVLGISMSTDNGADKLVDHCTWSLHKPDTPAPVPPINGTVAASWETMFAKQEQGASTSSSSSRTVELTEATREHHAEVGQEKGGDENQVTGESTSASTASLTTPTSTRSTWRNFISPLSILSLVDESDATQTQTDFLKPDADQAPQAQQGRVSLSYNEPVVVTEIEIIFNRFLRRLGDMF
ncbi:unnamed protein product [Amoebophrya sp. A25]|nr:unnamed protein product [Amoebophrya sp. A25]|eukprot:GSA25T00020610001.1